MSSSTDRISSCLSTRKLDSVFDWNGLCSSYALGKLSEELLNLPDRSLARICSSVPSPGVLSTSIVFEIAFTVSSSLPMDLKNDEFVFKS